MDVFSSSTENANTSSKGFYETTQGTQKAFVDLTNDAEGAGLTFAAIGDLEDEVEFLRCEGQGQSPD